ncbi:MPP4 protein, partial [Polypterus senegalus]
MASYCPQQDPAIPCADAGVPFRKGDILEVVDQTDMLWWQARKLSDHSTCAGLIPSSNLLRRKSQSSHQPCYIRCPASCYSAVASPYEEVVRYQRHPEDRYRLIVLVGQSVWPCGPSGVGVNELRRRLIEINPQTFQGPVPHTTRPPKSYEEMGREYHFVPRETFEQMVYNHRFLEFGQYKGNWYGTSVEAVKVVLDSRKICIIDLEPQAIQGMRTHELKPYIIFIKPPSISQMRQTRRSARIVTEYYTHRPFKVSQAKGGLGGFGSCSPPYPLLPPITQEEDLQEMEEAARRAESQYCQFFDHVLVNETLQNACVHLLTAVRRAQDEPQWVPASWLRPESQS